MNVTRWLIVVVVLAAAVSGCAREEGGAQAKPLSQAELDAMIQGQAVQDPYLRSQTDFGLDARRTGEGRIQATVANKTRRPIVVGPKCFGLIVAGQRRVIPAAAASLKSFPLAKVPAGEQVSGELVFEVNPIPEGARLIFIQPEAQPAMAAVK